MISPVAGVLHVDKPVGLTSHDVVNKVRRLSGIRRVGHSGTLDPLATGLLTLCLGQATRLVEYLVGLDKVYLVTIRLGQETNTYDGEGQITAEKPVEVTQQQLDNVLEQFRGQIEQVPPMFSAVKVDGQPLYRRARQGVDIERPARQVTVYDINQLSWQRPMLALRISCSSGTYIRSIAHDLGQVIGCGGHVASLRRTAIGEISIEEATPLDQLQPESWRQHLRPLDSAVYHLPLIELPDENVQKVSHGQRIPIEEVSHQTGDSPVRAYNQEGQFIGILIPVEGQWQPRKILYQPDL
jgi:tRNA pseudouridine55 synthase